MKKLSKYLPLLTAVFALPLCAQNIGREAQEFIQVPAGTFTMGSPETESWREKDELPHKVSLDSFYLGRTEVTQAEYERVMHANPSHFKGADLPVDSVSWFDAVRYCNERSLLEGLTPAYTVTESGVTWNRKANGVPAAD